MAPEIERWEMTRVIHKMDHLMHRYYCNRLNSDVVPDLLPELTPPQINMLMAIRESGSVTIKQLTHILKVKAPSASTMVDRLVEMGILTREENPADRREVLVRISPEMSVRIEQLERLVLVSLAEVLDRLGPKHSRMWYEVAGRLIDIMASEQQPCAKRASARSV